MCSAILFGTYVAIPRPASLVNLLAFLSRSYCLGHSNALLAGTRLRLALIRH